MQIELYPHWATKLFKDTFCGISLISCVLSLRAAETYWIVKVKLPGAESIFKHMFSQRRQLSTAWVLWVLQCSAVNFLSLKLPVQGKNLQHIVFPSFIKGKKENHNTLSILSFTMSLVLLKDWHLTA